MHACRVFAPISRFCLAAWLSEEEASLALNAINHGSGPRPGPSATSFSYAPTAARCSSPACLKAWRGKDENVHASKTGRRAAGSHARTARRTWEPTVAAPGASEPTRPPLSSSRQGILCILGRQAGFLLPVIASAIAFWNAT